jgi:hypothetical protein
MTAACILFAMAMPGGYVAEQAALIQTVDRLGCEVRIVGDCASACTMFLGARDVCVAPVARLTFHGPAASAASFDHWSEVMARHYPGQLYDLFMSELRWGEYRISGQWLIDNGIAEACE